MTTSANLRRVSRNPRIATLLVAALLWTGAPLQAGPVSGPVNAAAFLARGIIGIPFRILGTVAKGVSKGTGKGAKKDEPRK